MPILTKDNVLLAAPPVATEPSIALVFPFDPKMTPRAELDLAIKRLLGTAEKRLLTGYPGDAVLPVIKRLQQALRRLNYSTHKRSVAVWVSPSKTETTYMNFAVEERLFVDQPFRVRDIADCKPSGKECLLLLLTGKESKMYLHNGNGLKLIKTNGAQHVFAYLNEVPERTANFSDPADRHEVMLNKFLHHMDQGLAYVLKAYPLPVFVAGPERVAGHFSRITHHAGNIAAYIYKNCIHSPEKDLEALLQPLLDEWQQLRQKLLSLQLEKAFEAGKLVCGIEAVRKAARCSNSRLVVLETSAANPADFFTDGSVDQIVQRVLENGGDVEKLDVGGLGRFGPVALIRYY
ncbi:MAG TPA: hypothetical protein VGS79_25420 [Puia sp.]|nr:hypothetical protein [Puia sp.]